jgi:hypothetical protein
MAVRLIILGLRRSGTTIFWQTFRQDRRLVCYDEPLNPRLRYLPDRTKLKHPEEFLALLDRDALDFWKRYEPVGWWDELRDGLTERQRDYLRWLAATGDHVALDSTRCHFKIAELHALAPEATLVHLYRPPASHASSHMLPSGPTRRDKLRRRVRRTRFWTRPDRYDNWSLESIVGPVPDSLFGMRLCEIGLDPAEVYGLPAVGKLLSYWRVHHERIERDGPEHFGERFVSQSFDAFCRDPGPALDRIYAVMGLERPDLDVSRVHPPAGPYEPDSPEWPRYAELLGLPEV